MPEQSNAQQSSEAARCYWCGLSTIPWHAWRWCLKCEAPRGRDGQELEPDDD